MRKNSVVLALTAVVVAVFGGWLWYASNYLRRVTQGPESVTLTQLSSMGADAAGRWFDVTTEVRPGHLLQTTRRGRRSGTTITNHFALIRDKAVIVETSMSELPATFLAWSSEFDEDSDYYKRARRQLDQWTGVPSRLPLSPLLLRTSGGVASTQWLIGSAISAVAIVLIFMFWRTLRAMWDITRTAPIARLRKSVRATEGLPTLVAEIDHQLATLDPKVRRTGPLLLPSWLVNVTQNSFSLMSASDVIWVVPYTVRRKLYSLIPLSKTHQIHVVSRTGQTLSLQVPEDRVRDALTTFYRWAPWAVIGSDPGMDARFGKTNSWRSLTRLFSLKPSRAELVKAVDQRREQILAARAAQRGAA
jgi:hypothetical protein